ncbi:hypothetical protein RRG08_044246 [Elysia crispata]|uniref:Uncharacterized protein n=1 Tax=Elysia crispata TaxID=231223 RepID=A0AAE0XWN4_9GAST|nr:hypothetical protein RRG08_044246 [Elysia crispata]
MVGLVQSTSIQKLARPDGDTKIQIQTPPSRLPSGDGDAPVSGNISKHLVKPLTVATDVFLMCLTSLSKLHSVVIQQEV